MQWFYEQESLRQRRNVFTFFRFPMVSTYLHLACRWASLRRNRRTRAPGRAPPASPGLYHRPLAPPRRSSPAPPALASAPPVRYSAPLAPESAGAAALFSLGLERSLPAPRVPSQAPPRYLPVRRPPQSPLRRGETPGAASPRTVPPESPPEPLCGGGFRPLCGKNPVLWERRSPKPHPQSRTAA